MQCSAADNEEGKDGEAGGSGYDEAQQVMMLLHAADHKIATVAQRHPASHHLHLQHSKVKCELQSWSSSFNSDPRTSESLETIKGEA